VSHGQALFFKLQVSRGTILFATGGGGSPARHQVLIGRLRAADYAVIAPEFAMLAAPRASEAEMLERIAIMSASFVEADPALPLYGVGHSLGGALLLGFAGADMWHGPGVRLTVPHQPRLARVVALAPPVEFFGAPGAVEKLTIPIMLRSAGEDRITTPQSHMAFAARLAGHATVDFAVEPLAGHYSYMDVQPPGASDSLPDGAAFRAGIAEALLAFLVR
jgi:pimeloyl-ACP methyl ester carboxylesterase